MFLSLVFLDKSFGVADASCRRVGVVCEQYRLRRRQLLQVPRLAIFDQTNNREVVMDAVATDLTS